MSFNIFEPGNLEFIENNLKKIYPIENFYHVDIYWTGLLTTKKLIEIIPHSLNHTICFHLYKEARVGTIDFIFEKFIIPMQIDIKKIIFLVAGSDESDHIHKFCKDKNLDIPRTFIHSFYERLAKRKVYTDNIDLSLCNLKLEEITAKYDHNSFKINSPLEKEKLEKVFLFLNKEVQDVGSVITSDSYRSGMRRQHRITLLLALHARGLLNKGYISFPKLPSSSKLNWIYNLRPSLQKYVRQGYDILDKLPFILDQYDNDPLRFVFNYVHAKDDIIPFYKNSMVSIITETHFFTTDYDKRKCKFLTEKTFRPISLKQPFIIASVPGTLKELRRLGYKTFDGVIDESYDNIEDDDLRLLKIIDEIERLCNLNGETLDQCKTKMLPIVEHNYNLLMTRKDYFHLLRPTSKSVI